MNQDVALHLIDHTVSQQLSQEHLLCLCSQISDLIMLYPETMLQFSALEIAQYVKTARGVLISDHANRKKAVAFAKLYEWPGKTGDGRTLFELGSWIVHKSHRGKGYGIHVLMETMKLGKAIDPNAQIITVSEHTNSYSQQIIMKMGGKILRPSQWPSNYKVLLQNGNATVILMDVSEII